VNEMSSGILRYLCTWLETRPKVGNIRRITIP
jgi:hypothetical protein